MITHLQEWIQATAWPMEEPPSYGWFHILFVLIFGAISVGSAWHLRNCSEKANRRILLGVGLFLAISELYKQLFYLYVVSPGGYSWWIFPFQLCSIPMYMCLILPWLKVGKVQCAMYDFMMYFNLLGGAISFAEPSGLLHPYWTLTLHACLWHMCLVFLGLYIVFSRRGGRELPNYHRAAITFICLCVVAFSINLLFWKPSGGTINMFFVGPANSSLIVFKQIAQHFGWYVSTLLYIPVVCLGAYLVYLPIHFAGKKNKVAV